MEVSYGLDREARKGRSRCKTDPPPRLPPELLSKIVAYFTNGRVDHASILSFMLACREFHAVGEPFLWRTIEYYPRSTETEELVELYEWRFRQMLETGRRLGTFCHVRRVSLVSDEEDPAPRSPTTSSRFLKLLYRIFGMSIYHFVTR